MTHHQPSFVLILNYAVQPLHSEKFGKIDFPFISLLLVFLLQRFVSFSLLLGAVAFA